MIAERFFYGVHPRERGYKIYAYSSKTMAEKYKKSIAKFVHSIDREDVEAEGNVRVIFTVQDMLFISFITSGRDLYKRTGLTSCNIAVELNQLMIERINPIIFENFLKIADETEEIPPIEIDPHKFKDEGISKEVDDQLKLTAALLLKGEKVILVHDLDQKDVIEIPYKLFGLLFGNPRAMLPCITTMPGKNVMEFKLILSRKTPSILPKGRRIVRLNGAIGDEGRRLIDLYFGEPRPPSMPYTGSNDITDRFSSSMEVSVSDNLPESVKRVRVIRERLINLSYKLRSSHGDGISTNQLTEDIVTVIDELENIVERRRFKSPRLKKGISVSVIKEMLSPALIFPMLYLLRMVGKDKLMRRFESVISDLLKAIFNLEDIEQLLPEYKEGNPNKGFKGEDVGKRVNVCIERIWNSGVRSLWVKIDENGRGRLETPGLSIGLASSRDVAKLNEAISEAKTTGSASFVRSDGRPLTVWRGDDGSINIQGMGNTWIHIKSMEDVAKLQRALHSYFEG